MLYCKPLPPLDRIRNLLALRSDGVLVWKRPTSNRVKAGQVAGRWNKGYRIVSIDGSGYAVHRVVWALCCGKDPGQLEIDHINGDPSDNRPSNLRACNREQNTFNTKRRSDNTSGTRGISYDPSSTANPWRAYIRTKKLGRFATKDDAIQALMREIVKDENFEFYHSQNRE